jgi:hypothetical protein
MMDEYFFFNLEDGKNKREMRGNNFPVKLIVLLSYTLNPIKIFGGNCWIVNDGTGLLTGDG